jgi:hypothetical protein
VKRSRPILAVAVLSVVGLTSLSSLPVQAGRIQAQAVPSAQTTAYALVGTISLPGTIPFNRYPAVSALAVSLDDTVYAPTSATRYVGIITPGRASGSLDDSLPTTDSAWSVAVSRDDTLYVLDGLRTIASYRPDLSLDDSVELPTNRTVMSLSRDDTIAATSQAASVTFVDGRSMEVASTVATSGNPVIGGFDSLGRFWVGVVGNNLVRMGSSGLAVDDTIPLGGLGFTTVINSDDTKYVANQTLGRVDVIGPTSGSVDYAVPVGTGPRSLAFTPTDELIVVNVGSRSLSLIGRNANMSDTIITGFRGDPRALVVTSTGLAYVSVIDPYEIEVAAPVSASLSTASGPAGSSVGVGLTGLPAASVVDDSTFLDVWWGDDTVAFTRDQGRNSVSLTVPPGSGSVPVVLQLRGGNAVTAGTFTYGAPTPPAPALATPPRDVTAQPGDGSASVSWLAPASAGSFPVTNYLVTSAPGGRTCLTTSLTCTLHGLVNGTSYAFTVRALNGAGWSTASEPSNAVTPRADAGASIVITGSRDGNRIAVSGRTTGFEMGGLLRPWLRFPGQSAHRQGSATILVSADGTFEWGRKTGKRVSVYVQTPDGSVRSNSVMIAAR